MGAIKCSRQQNGDKQNYCAGHKVLKYAARTSVVEKINPKMGTKLSYSPKDGQASGVFTQINNMKTRGTESSPIADDEY